MRALQSFLPTTLRHVLLTSIFLGLLGLGSAQAQTTNLWIRNSASLNHWTNATAWSPTNPPNAIDSVAIFGVVNTANRTITNIGTALNLGRLMFTNTNSFNWILTNTAGGTMTFNVSSGSAQIIVTNPGMSIADSLGVVRVGTTILADPLQIHHSGFTNLFLADMSGTGDITATVTETGNHGIDFAGPLSVTGNLIKNGAGRVILTRVNNSFTGNLTLNAGELRINGDGSLGNANNDLNFNGGLLRVQTNFTMPASRVLTMQAGGGVIFNQTNGGPLILDTPGQLAGSGALTKTNAGTLAINAANLGFSGPVFVNGGFLSLGDADALGTAAAVTVNPGGIFLQTVTANAGNTFNVASNGVISGPGSFMASLTRGVNLIAGTGAIIASSDNGGNNSINNLGTAADLVYGIGGDVSDTITFGGASPWAGLGNDGLNRTLFDSTINANGNFAMQSAVGVGADSFLNLGGTMTIVAASPITVTIPQGNVRLASSVGSYSNVTFLSATNSFLSGISNNVLGGSGVDDPATKAIVRVANGGRFTVGSVLDGVGNDSRAAINSSVIVSNGGTFEIAAKGVDGLSSNLNGTGTITLAPLAYVRISGSNAFVGDGTQLPTSALNAGQPIQLQVNDITSLNTLGSNLLYIVNGASRTQAAGFFLSGGTITTDNGTRNLAGSGITIGNSGATLAGAVNVDTNGIRTVRALTNQMDITVGESGTGLLYIGSTAAPSTYPDNRPRDGTVILAGGFPSNNLVFVSGGLHIGEIHSNSVLNGTLLTNVLVPDRGRIGFRLPSMTNTVETATPVAQLITITGGLEPQDERNLLVQRSIAAGTVRVDLTNVVLKPGSVLAVDEDSANVRTALILEGTATLTDTADSDVFDLLSLTASNPGDPRTVILGRTNATDTFPATSPFINGAIGDNFTFEMINMGLRISNSATLGANMVINNLGTNYVHPTAGQYQEGNPVFDNGRDGIGAPVGNNVTVNLGSGENVTVIVDETDIALPPLTNIFGGRVNIYTNQVGVLNATRGVDTNNVGTVVFADVRLSPGATAELAGANQSNILGTATLDGPATISNNSGSNVRMMVDTIVNGAFPVTIAGPNRVNLLSSVTGSGNVIVTNGGRLGGVGTITGALQVQDGGRLEPGLAGPGALTASSVVLGLASTNIFEINSNVVSGIDRLLSAGTINISGALQATVVPTNYMPHPTNVFTIITGGSRFGFFTNVANGERIAAGASNGTFRVDYTATGVNLTDYQSRADLDADGIADTWAQTYFGGSPLSPAQLAADDDGDGQSNLDEYVAGTNPTNAASRFLITQVFATGTNSLAVLWVHNNTGLNKATAYTIQYTDDLTTAYTNVTGPTISFPVPGTAQWIDDGTLTGGTAPLNLPTKRHYRVQAQ